MPKGTTIRVKQARDARTGGWVSLDYARTHKGTTVVEIVTKKKKHA